MAKGGSRVGAGRKPKAKAAPRVSRAKAPAASTPPAEPPVMIAPDYLSAEAAAEFATLAKMLDEQGRANQHHASILGELAQQLVLIADLQKVIKTEGVTYETKTAAGDRLVRARPEMAMLTAAQKHAHALLNDLMLTPTSALRMGGPPKKKTNAFADL